MPKRAPATAAKKTNSKPDPRPARGPKATNATSAKIKALEAFHDAPSGAVLTSDQGVAIPHTDDSLKAGLRGPTLLDDFHLREKITHFDHERIPERVVHARGSAAHGVFQVYDSLEQYTSAGFLCDPRRETPVFVRFSTVVGSRGSADTARDVRGFATKFYTQEGNFDLVGNNMPVFFIQDGIKFPDLVHAVKPEPAHEMPQAASAHDSFWDFVSLVPETAHMVMWLMSDRAIPRSLRMMEGFGVHTFRLINAKGKSSFVKFHWKPLLGAHSLVWDEALTLMGKDPDFHRRDLWNAIESGAFPEWELGLQIIPAGDELKYDFDLLDATKLVPEELVPVQRVGKLTLNRNPQNFFAETEQVAFHVGNLVPGIGITNDPLFQARLFSYVDTQLTRLGGPNFAEIPINRPIAAVANHHQDGLQRTTINTGTANYHPNSLGGGCPFLADAKSGYAHFPEPVDGVKTRERSERFLDHFSQATLFLHSLSAVERQHLTDACRFELSKVTRKEVRARVLSLFREIDPKLAEDVSIAIGVAVPKSFPVPPSGTRASTHRGDNGGISVAPSLSLEHQPKTSIKTRKVAVLAADGFEDEHVIALQAALVAAGATAELVSPVLGMITGARGKKLEVDKTFKNAASVFYDAVFVPGGAENLDALRGNIDARLFVAEAFRHCKTLGAAGEGVALLAAADLADVKLATGSKELVDEQGVVTAGAGVKTHALVRLLIAALATHRHWERASG